jgi:hypothetical protein
MDQGQLWNIISFTSPFVLLVGVLFGVLKFRRLKKSNQLLVFYLGFSLTFDLLSRYFGYIAQSKYNLFLIPIYGFLELGFLSVLYYRYILRSKSKYLLSFIVFMHLLILVEIFFGKGLFHPESFQSFGKVIADASIILYSIYFYLKIFKGQIPIRSEYAFLNAVVLIYFSINLIIYLAINFLVNAQFKLVVAFWIINLLSVIIFELILISLLWKDGRTRKTLP